MSQSPSEPSVPPSQAPNQGFDATLHALKQVVERLESGQLSLEAALTAFEEGVRLARQGAQILDDAERRVEVLTRNGGEPHISPMPSNRSPEGP